MHQGVSWLEVHACNSLEHLQGFVPCLRNTIRAQTPLGIFDPIPPCNAAPKTGTLTLISQPLAGRTFKPLNIVRNRPYAASLGLD